MQSCSRGPGEPFLVDHCGSVRIIVSPQELVLCEKQSVPAKKLELIPVPCGTRALTGCLALCCVLSGSPAWPCVFWGDRLVLFAQDFPCFKTVIPGSKEAPPAWANPDGWSSLSSHTGKFCLMATLSIRAKTALLIARYLGLLLSTLER